MSDRSRRRWWDPIPEVLPINPLVIVTPITDGQIIAIADDLLVDLDLGSPFGPSTYADLLALNLVAPDYPAYYYVDYYDNDNNVIHLLPSQVFPVNQVSPRQRLRIGGTEKYAINPPFGLDLVIAVGSSVIWAVGDVDGAHPARTTVIRSQSN